MEWKENQVEQALRFEDFSWRADLLRIVDALFPVTVSDVWDELLDFRQALIQGDTWDLVLDLFLRCRRSMELDHYLPFYRMRKLLSCGLRLEASAGCARPVSPDLFALMAKNPSSFEAIRQSIRRDWFEFDLDVQSPALVCVRVTERTVAAV